MYGGVQLCFVVCCCVLGGVLWFVAVRCCVRLYTLLCGCTCVLWVDVCCCARVRSVVCCCVVYWMLRCADVRYSVSLCVLCILCVLLWCCVFGVCGSGLVCAVVCCCVGFVLFAWVLGLCLCGVVRGAQLCVDVVLYVAVNCCV